MNSVSRKRVGLPIAGEFVTPVSSLSIPVMSKGFRPFFFMAACFAIAMIPIWVLSFVDAAYPLGYLDMIYWHAHEMIFGFSVAVIAGFLLTAVGNWTGRETAIGFKLLALSVLWLLGRVLMSFGGGLPKWLCAGVDLLFLPALIFVLAGPIIAAKNKNNWGVLGVLVFLFFMNLSIHFGWGRPGCLIAIDGMIFLILLITGRILVPYTRNRVNINTIRSHPILDKFTLASMAGLILFELFLPSESMILTVLALLTAILALLRSVHWGARYSFHDPMLWILHLGYLWVPIGLFLRGILLFWPAIPASISTHALTVGALGSLTLGMMSRVTLGHTGHNMVASTSITGAFMIVTCAALTRVFLPILVPSDMRSALILSGLFWTLAFALFLVSYTSILLKPRADGMPG